MPSNKQNTRDQIILASLLHDIGKFWQRGDSKLEDSQNIANPSQNWGWLVPYNDHNRPKYQHTIWTFQFIENHKSDFDKLGLWQPEEEKLSNLSAKHHLPDNYLQSIIQLADWWSSGIDRTQIFIDDNTSALNIPPECIQDWGKISFKKLPLHSIFDTLKIKNKDGIYSINKKCHGYNLRALSLAKEDIFPYRININKVNEIKEKSLSSEYEKLWNDFNKEFELLPKGNISAFISSLTYLLKKYTWCIPSSTIDMPNVSLFEHLKTTAAIAGCLFEYGESLKNSLGYEGKRIGIDKDNYPIKLCCIDLSGIQNFIYDISSSKAYKSLKGRSFYLQLLLDRILDFLLFELDQHHVNIIYSSGGKAYFLLPNTESVNKKIPSLLIRIEKMLWNEHKGKIFAAFGSVPFKYNFQKGSTGKVQSNYQFPNGKFVTNLGDLWKAVSDLSSFQKTRRFKSLITEDFDAFFNENHQNSKIEQYPEVCEVTGQPFERDEKNNLVSSNIGRDNEDNKISVLPSVKQQVELGKELKDAKIIFSHPNNDQNRFNQKGKKSSFSFGELNKSILLLSEDPQELNSEINKWGTAVNSQFSTINSTDFLKSIINPSSQAGSGFIFYGGNSQPEINLKEYPTGSGRPKTLEELCWLNDQKHIESENESYSKLGILRMDVDNLGQIFINGL
jgi:CRISPR-associated protein Csm1